MKRWLGWSVCTLLLACSGSAQVRETIARPRSAASRDPDEGATSSTGMPSWGGAASSGSAARAQKPRSAANARLRAETAPEAPPKPVAYRSTAPRAEPAPKAPAPKAAPKPAAYAAATTEDDEEEDEDDSQSDAAADPQERAVAVRGIEGTMSEYDVKSTLEGRAREFDRCHDVRGRAGSGRITFRIRILPSGEVSDVRVRQSSVRDRALIGCYSDVVKSSTFPTPHGGYADVNWSTKVGRSRARPGDVFERRGRWDAPSSSGRRAARQARGG